MSGQSSLLLRKQLAGKLEHELLLIQKFYRKVLHVVRVFQIHGTCYLTLYGVSLHYCKYQSHVELFENTRVWTACQPAASV